MRNRFISVTCVFSLELPIYVLEPISCIALTDSFHCQELEPLVGVIVSQIRALFGLPPTLVKNSKAGIFGVPAAVTGIADWFVALSLLDDSFL